MYGPFYNATLAGPMNIDRSPSVEPTGIPNVLTSPTPVLLSSSTQSGLMAETMGDSSLDTLANRKRQHPEGGRILSSKDHRFPTKGFFFRIGEHNTPLSSAPRHSSAEVEAEPSVAKLPNLHAGIKVDIGANPDAYGLPSPDTQEILLSAFLECVHPIYPILDWSTFYASFRNGEFSTLLLQSILFMGSHHCEEYHLNQVGFSNRAKAISTFYRRAEALFDANVEPDAMKRLQAAFMLQFWSSMLQSSKDTWYWLGVSIRLAQSMNLHKEVDDQSVPISIQKLRKRIWWCLFVWYRFDFVIKIDL